VPELSNAPAWLTDVSVVAVIIFFGFGLSRNWFYTSGQVDRMAEQYQRVNDIWEKVATERQQTIQLLSTSLTPINQSNAEILRSVNLLHQDCLGQQHVDRRRSP
jgi:hypothetical protein